MINELQYKFRNDRTQTPVFYEAGDFEGNCFRSGNLREFNILTFIEAVARDAGYDLAIFNPLYARSASFSLVICQRSGSPAR